MQKRNPLWPLFPQRQKIWKKSLVCWTLIIAAPKTSVYYDIIIIIPPPSFSSRNSFSYLFQPLDIPNLFSYLFHAILHTSMTFDMCIHPYVYSKSMLAHTHFICIYAYIHHTDIFSLSHLDMHTGTEELIVSHTDTGKLKSSLNQSSIFSLYHQWIYLIGER